MPTKDREKYVVRGVGNNTSQQQHTFHAQLNKMPFEVIDCCEKNLHMQDELFRHPYGFQILSAAHVS
jgi:hypothetical protein